MYNLLNFPVKEIPFAYLYILQNCYSEYKPNFRINVYTFLFFGRILLLTAKGGKP